jgi:hypothetical protein
MEIHLLRPAVLCESLVLLFQVAGVAGLLLSRLLTRTAWAGRGKWILMFALVGLAVAGSVAGHHRSSFGLLAGGTMTILLVGMTAGTHTTPITGTTLAADPLRRAA